MECRVGEERELSSSDVERICREGGVGRVDCGNEGEFWVRGKDDAAGVRGERGVEG